MFAKKSPTTEREAEKLEIAEEELSRIIGGKQVSNIKWTPADIPIVKVVDKSS